MLQNPITQIPNKMMKPSIINYMPICLMVIALQKMVNSLLNHQSTRHFHGDAWLVKPIACRIFLGGDLAKNGQIPKKWRCTGKKNKVKAQNTCYFLWVQIMFFH